MPKSSECQAAKELARIEPSVSLEKEYRLKL